MGCPATVILREILYFPEYKVSFTIFYKKEEAWAGQVRKQFSLAHTAKNTNRENRTMDFRIRGVLVYGLVNGMIMKMGSHLLSHLSPVLNLSLCEINFIKTDCSGGQILSVVRTNIQCCSRTIKMYEIFNVIFLSDHLCLY